ncbi:MAG TPA: RluA family pseudouridine synthase [Bacteroidales bacterium]|nr:MAG: hypothetical protein A2X11_06525 [Bacteroidetes bacterium GWE2_42_24]OFY25667.1 MAG: hypothetical protein A2X09_01750 [Bacteroidetes bacterium GWF2_43_11]HAQ64585.1 RluA family pseudouridine synthase [Bacteroidales bacterium]HBZ68074.1 RluA family pseudouridine synthase [Bacteroidales bacterium]
MPSSHHESSVTVSTRLLDYLLTTYASKGRILLKKVLTAGQVSVNGRQYTRHDVQLVPGDKVLVSWIPLPPKPVFSKLNLEYQDDHILVINKMAGLLSVATDHENELTAYRQLRDYVKATQPGKGLYIVHRLDRDTSGLMLFAKSEKVQESLQRTWAETIISRRYVAVAEGVVLEEKGTITSYLRESKALKMHSSPHSSDGDLAITHYKLLKKGAHYTLLELELETGRKNQIRVHLSDMKHPVAGDKKYGAKTNPIGRLALHAAGLAFTHPVTGKLMEFRLPVPGKFLHLVAAEL